MNLNKYAFCAGLLFLLSFCLLSAQNVLPTNIIYLSPKPKSFHNHPATNIIVRLQSPIDLNLIIGKGVFSISSNSINIAYSVKILEGNKIILLQPLSPLPLDAKIKVELTQSLTLGDNKVVRPFEFDFYTTSGISKDFVNNEPSLPKDSKSTDKMVSSTGETGSQTISEIIKNQIPIAVTANNHTSKGYYFMTAISTSASYPHSCIILNNNGKIIYDKQFSQFVLDFKKLHGQTFSFFNTVDGFYHLLDSKFEEKGIVKAGNGYLTDNHELQYDKRNGNYILLAQESVQVNMSDSVAGGNPNANVLGLIIQEIDQQGNVVFEWKTLDHLAITSCKGQNLAASYIDYVHCNAVEIDSDTSLLLCSRHLNEITKIDRRTGDIIWRMGLNADHNNFNFGTDQGFTYQHDIRRLPNGNITLFDNGNFRSGGNLYSRAVEYEVDEVHKKVRMVWQYDDSQQVFGPFLGRVQRMSNGNTLIGWGGTYPAFTEIDSANNKVMEVSYGRLAWSYRCHRYDDLDSIININQVPLLFRDTLGYCNIDSSTAYENLAGNLLPPFLLTDFFEIKRDNNLVNVYTKTPNYFFNSGKTNIQFYVDKLKQKDTVLCLGSSLKLNSTDACKNLIYKWSTNDSTPYLNIAPTKSSTYWVEMKNGTYTRRDSIRVNVSSVPSFSILGAHQYVTPYQVITYSVPYNSTNKFTWDIDAGNVIAGFGTNAVTVQLDYVDTINITSEVTNIAGCKNIAKIIVYKQNPSSGVKELGNEAAINVYPNPTTGIVNVLTAIDNYKLYDLTGRLVKSAVKSNGQNLSQINMEELPSGSYLLYLSIADKQEHVKIEKY
ncbi:MAG: aryl-sulfate sulfotransferase [Bacteroidia bacterium]|nr:aryl-sulfate sulfotransferase [Bacteroidia bacterium]